MSDRERVIAGQVREATLTGAPSGRVATISLRVIDPPAGTIIVAADIPVVTETVLAGGISDYTATYTPPATAGQFLEVWLDTTPTPDYEVTQPIEIVVGGLPDPPGDAGDIVTQVAILLRHRTRGKYPGDPEGTFSTDTRPSLTVVESAVAIAAQDVHAKLGTIDPSLDDERAALIATRAAYLLERGADEPRQQIVDDLDDDYKTKLLALEEAAAEVGAGDEQGPADDHQMAYYSFPAPPASRDW